MPTGRAHLPAAIGSRRTRRARIRPRWGAAVAAALCVAVVPVAGACRPVVPVEVAGCEVFPANNVWRADVSGLPVHARSAEYLASISLEDGLKADYGSGLWDGGPIGIPYTVVSGDQPRVPVRFEYADESDPGPYPIPPDAAIEGGPDADGDRHILLVDRDHCVLYEIYKAYPAPDGSWDAGSGAVYDLRSNALRPAGWTSADAAGLPMLPGLVRYDEVASGVVGHAIRFTAPRTQRAYVWPARHFASDDEDPSLPPMGLRVRLKATVDPAGFPEQVRPVVRALQTYGMILADNGAPWYLSGVPDERWDNDELRALLAITAADLEVVDTSSLVVDPETAEVPWPVLAKAGAGGPAPAPSAAPAPGP